MGNYPVYKIVGVTKNFVYLVDYSLLFGNLSVTNGAETVVSEVHAKFPGRRILYRDTMGRWDELVHENGVFTKFAPYNIFSS